MAVKISDVLEVLPHTNDRQSVTSESEVVRCENTGKYLF